MPLRMLQLLRHGTQSAKVTILGNTETTKKAYTNAEEEVQG
jgi:hypothetical protein